MRLRVLGASCYPTSACYGVCCWPTDRLTETGLIQQRIIRDQEACKYHKRLCSRLRIVKLMYCIMIKINSNKKNTSLINEMFSQRLPEANLQAVTQEHFIGQHITTPKSPTLIHAMQEGNEQLKKGIRMHFPPALIPSCGSDTGYVP